MLIQHQQHRRKMSAFSLVLGIIFSVTRGTPIPEEKLLLSLISYFHVQDVTIVKEHVGESDALLIALQKSLSLLEKRSAVIDDITDVTNCTCGPRKCMVFSRLGNSILKDTSLPQVFKTVQVASLIWVVTTPRPMAVEDFAAFEIPFECEFVIGAGDHLSGYNIVEVYQTTSGKWLRNDIGRWTPADGLLATDVSFYSRRNNLQGTILKIIGTDMDPCSLVSWEEGSHTISRCVIHCTWFMIADMMNITSDLVVQSHDIQDFIQSDAHVNLKDISMAPVFMEGITFFWPIFTSTVDVFLAYTGLDVNWKTFLQPFTSGIWFATICWIVSSAAAFTMMRYLHAAFRGRKPAPDDIRKYSWVSFFAFCNQGFSEEPKSVKHRIVFLMLLLAPGVLVPAYSAALTSFLTLHVPLMPFRNFDEFSYTKEYKLIGRRLFNLKTRIQFDTHPIMVRIRENVLAPDDEMPETEWEGNIRICQRKEAVYQGPFTMLILRPPCEFYKLDFSLLTIYTSFVMAQNSPYQVLFNRWARKIHYTGVQAATAKLNFRKYWRFSQLKKHGEENSDEQFLPITFENTILLSMIICLGVSSSTFILFLELFRHKKQIRQVNGKTQTI